jgi:hypothetical protein
MVKEYNSDYVWLYLTAIILTQFNIKNIQLQNYAYMILRYNTLIVIQGFKLAEIRVEEPI